MTASDETTEASLVSFAQRTPLNLRVLADGDGRISSTCQGHNAAQCSLAEADIHSVS
jgi:hypothetical protein